jgi:hypothetical protein
MVERAFEVLFVLSLLAPAAAIVVGVWLVAWPRRRARLPSHARVAPSPH